jgi:hypothetical protein
LEETNGLHPDVSFDIVVGNPPYGDILNGSEEAFTAPFLTGSVNDVSAPFVERQLQLTAEDGYFGNVTTLRLIYQSSLSEFHDLLRSNLDPARVACFGFRPSRVFENAHVRVALITGRKADTDTNRLLTSDLLLFNEGNREEVMADIQYGQTEDLILRDRIDGDDGSPILPKVGGETKYELLCELRDQSDVVLGDRFERDEPDEEAYKLYKRRGVLYWINPMLEKLYDGSEVVPVWFDSEVERDVAFLTLNSSLYFVYWQTYSNQHHHNWSHLRPFPFPDEDRIDARSEEIQSLAETLWERMKDTFSQSSSGRGDFFMGTLRPIIDDVDALMGDLYDLTDEQVEYTQTYLTDLGENSGRAGTGDDVAYDPVVADDD